MASPSAASSADAPAASGGDREYVSFEEQFEAEAREQFGDLGPAGEAAAAAGRPAGGGGGEGRGGGGPRRNRDRRRR